MLVEKIQNVVAFLSSGSGVNFDGERYVIDKSKQTAVEDFGLPFEEFGNELRLKFKTYFQGENLKYFEILEQDVKNNEIDKPILAISVKGFICRYDSQKNAFEEYGNKDDSMLLRFKNLIAYFSLLNCVKSTAFSDYYNSANDEIIFYSSINGIIKVKHDAIPPKFEQPITETTSIIADLSKSIEVSPFLINSFYIFSKSTGIISFEKIIKQGNEIISITKRDYQLVSKKFDFEKFRDSLYREKEKFFTSIRELISKIFSQAIGIPISISASVFATYKVSDDSFMLLLVLLAFSLYVAFYIKIQCIYRSDLEEIEKDFEESFLIIVNNSGLSEQLVEAERKKIQHKISSTRDIIYWSIALVSFLALLVVIYIFYELFSNEVFSFIRFLFLHK